MFYCLNCRNEIEVHLEIKSRVYNEIAPVDASDDRIKRGWYASVVDLLGIERKEQNKKIITLKILLGFARVAQLPLNGRFNTISYSV